MRVLLAAAFLATVFSTGLVQAKQRYGMAGCGLGSLVFDPGSGQISAATTNGTGIQGIGITLGTSNCLEENEIARVEAQEQFVAANLPALSKEMAQGEGEYLEAFAYTMGCKKEAYSDFARHMQGSYQEIFSAPGAMAVLSAIREEIKSDERLAHQCDTVI